jgi:O-antigen/teichoic acid export membrane protein
LVLPVEREFAFVGSWRYSSWTLRREQSGARARSTLDRMTTPAGNGAAHAAEDFDRLAHEATIRSSGLVFDKILGYVFFLLVTKTYGSTDFSVYLAGVAAVEITLALAELGLERAAIRAVAQHRALGRPGEVRGVVRSTLTLVVPTGLLAAGGAFVFADAIASSIGRPEAGAFLRAVAPSIPLSLVADALLWSAEGFGLQRYMTVIRMVVEPIVKTTLTMLLFAMLGEAAGPLWLGLAFSISTGVSAVLAVIVYRVVILPRTARPSRESQVRPLLRDGIPLWGNTLLARLFAKADVILLYTFASAPSAALYAMAYNTSLLTSTIATAFEAAFRPSVARAVALGERAALGAQYVRVSRIVLTICLPASAMLIAFPAQVMAVVGDQFVAIAHVVPVLATGTLVAYVVGPAGSVLIMAGRARVPLTNGLVAGFLTLATEFVLIPRLGALGAAMAQCAGVALASALNGLAARRYLGLASLSRAHASPALAAIGAVAAGFVVLGTAPANKYASFAVVGAAVVGVYGLILAILGVAEEDKQTIRGLWTRIRPF